MGNTSSSPRELLRNDEGRQTIRTSYDRPQSPSREETRNTARSMFSPSRYNTISGSRRRTSHRLSFLSASGNDDFISAEDRAVEQEHRPLVSTPGSVSLEDPAEESLNRRHSTMSRLGSRLLPDSVARGLLSSGEETAEEGQALRQGISSRTRTSVYNRRVPSSSNDRFSVPNSFRRRLEPRPEPTRRTVRSLFPTMTDHEALQDFPRTIFGPAEPARDGSSQPEGDNNDRGLQRSRSRLHRFRNSLPVSLSNIFGGHHSREVSRYRREPLPTRPVRIGNIDDSDQLLPPVSTIDHHLDLEDSPHELDAVDPETRNILSTSRIASGMSTIRRFPHGLRSRSTRLIRRGEHPPLSQVLQLAAAAIAAQLSGSPSTHADGANMIGGEAFDGSIQNFVQTLQDAASAQTGEDIDLYASDGDLPPVNFMRVFQFPNDENGSPMATQAHPSDVVDLEESQSNIDSDRSVTLVLVGVRSMPNTQDGSSHDDGALGPSLDTLLNLPFLPPANIFRNGSSGALLRRSDTRIRPQNRRHSMTNFNFPQQYESQRHQRTRTPALRASGEPGLLIPNYGSPVPASESPPGPHPPPSTPADIRSGHATPNRRPSSASAAHTYPLPDLEEDQVPEVSASAVESTLPAARQRRRSDSEFARRPELSSGNSRRNGMVEPDRTPAGVGRSWLIYVVGTNVSPDHPAFTMPSLFTDNPSYEDMQMLSTLLGPVKPPVATQNDVDSAGGLYRIALQNDILIAQPLAEGNEHVISIARGERCLICLCDYVSAEEVRQIHDCRHMYHRECIDEWLMTGRNSCPMCRGEGVKENGSGSPAPDETGSENLVMH